MLPMFLRISLLSFAVTSKLAMAEVLSCQDVHGQEVKVEFITSMLSPAGAFFRNGMPIIRLDPTGIAWASYSQSFVQFAYMHECGHFTLGHVDSLDAVEVSILRQNELDADCWASSKLRERGLSSEEFSDIVKDLRSIPEDPHHPDGKIRAEAAARCFAGN